MSNRRLAVPAIVASAFAILFFGLGSFLGARPSTGLVAQGCSPRVKMDIFDEK